MCRNLNKYMGKTFDNICIVSLSYCFNEFPCKMGSNNNYCDIQIYTHLNAIKIYNSMSHYKTKYYGKPKNIGSTPWYAIL